jgi:uncharacterized C2H2 Zn-finger protein
VTAPVKRRKPKPLVGCPRCGSLYTVRAGLTICTNAKCGYSPNNSINAVERLLKPRDFEQAREVVSHPYLESWLARSLKL